MTALLAGADGLGGACARRRDAPPTSAKPAPAAAAACRRARGAHARSRPPQLAELAADGARGHTAVLDLTTSANYVKRHIPGAWFALRSQLAQAAGAHRRGAALSC